MDGRRDAANSYHTFGARASVPELEVWAQADDGVVDMGAYESGTTGIGEVKEENFIRIYPNPFSTFLTIETDQPLSNNTEFLIYDMLGQIIKRVKVNPSAGRAGSAKFNIERDGMKSGMYFYQLKNNHKIITNGKLFVE